MMKVAKQIAGATLLVAYGGFTQVADAQATYTMTQVTDQNASYGSLAGINNNGEIAGRNDGGAFLWRDGVSVDLSKVLGTYSPPAGINEFGQIAGYYNGPSSGFLYSDGVVTDLGTVKNSHVSNPDGLNNLGEVVFTAVVFPPDVPDIYYWSYIYRNGRYEQIPTLGGTYVRGYAINDLGAVAGDSTFKGDNQAHAFVYQNGQMTDIGTLGGPHSRAHGINQTGHVVGYSYLANSSDQHAFFYDPSAAPGQRMIDLGVLPGQGRNSYASAVNNLNQVVGASEITAGSTEQHAFVYTNGTMWNLNKLIHANDPLRGYVRLFVADGINDDGWIIAAGVDERTPDFIRGYLLKPVAESKHGWNDSATADDAAIQADLERERTGGAWCCGQRSGLGESAGHPRSGAGERAHDGGFLR